MKYPKLRNDLIISRQQAAGENCYIVKDLARGNFFRFLDAERFILDQFDGNTSLETVQQRAEEEFGATLPMETLRSFVLTLAKSGLLDLGISIENSSRPRKKQWVRGNLLYLRFPAFDPDRLFTRLAKKASFFQTPFFVVLSTIFILAAMGVTVTHWGEVSQDISRLYEVSAIPLIMATMLVVVTAHEFAHGLTCKHFGGEVHEVGFMLIYFQPAFYCNVSDAWLFPEKSRRLWVGFAGPFFELFIWSIATFLWLLTNPDTLINLICLIVMTSSGVKTLLNFNPLIKLDGYYLLSDYLEAPNLRRRAFLYIGDALKKLAGLTVEKTVSPTPRERRIYIIYGLIATTASFSLLLLVIIQSGKILIENNQPILLATFFWFVGLRLRQRLRRMFSRSGGPDDEDDFGALDPIASTAVSDVAADEKSEKRPQAEPVENTALEKSPPKELAENNALEKSPSIELPDNVLEKNPPKELAESGDLEKSTSQGLVAKRDKIERRSSHRSGRSRKPRSIFRRLPLRWLVILVAIPLILYYCKLEHRIAGHFNILPIRSVDVRADIEGIIETIAVNEGDQVREKDLIARLSDKDLRPELAKTEAHIQQMRSRLQLLEAGPTAMEIEVSKSAVARAQESLKYAQSHASRNQKLFTDQLISRKDLEITQEQVALAENQLIEANNKLNVILQGTRPEEIAATKSEIDGLETQRRHFEDQLRRLNIYSAANGVIATPARQLKEIRRQLVRKGDLIAKIYDPKNMTAEILISEREITDIKVGQKVSLKALAYPDMIFEGHVTGIGVAALGSEPPPPASSSPSGASVPRSGSGSKTILVITQLENNSLLLKPEMTGYAKIFCGEKRLVELLRWRLARIVKVEFWSWW